MSPKEEATAVSLLVRWLEQTTGPATQPLADWAKKLDQLEADTRAFIAHEDPQG
jgi:hypothetical protein